MSVIPRSLGMPRQLEDEEGQDMEAMTYSELRALCRALLCELDIHPPLDPIDLCAKLGQARGCPIKLMPKVISIAAAAANLMTLPSRMIITYQKSTTISQQAHIIYHEVIHVVRNHAAEGSSLMCGPLMAANDERDGLLQSVNLYGEWQEWEAETGATILSEWTGPQSGRAAKVVNRRLSNALGAWDLR